MALNDVIRTIMLGSTYIFFGEKRQMVYIIQMVRVDD